MRGLLLLVWLLGGGFVWAADGEGRLQVSEELDELGRTARASGVPILLMYSASDCDYCRRLEEDVLGPMTLSGIDPQRVLLRKVMVEESQPLRDFQGRRRSGSDFAHANKVWVVPMVVLVDGDGRELVPRIAGYNSPDFYGYYLDQAIEVSRQLLTRR